MAFEKENRLEKPFGAMARPLAQFPSLSVAIVRDGKIAYRGVFGFENIEAGRKASPETSYQVASVTKVFTTSLAVMLDQRGVVDLDKPVTNYLPKDVSIGTKPELRSRSMTSSAWQLATAVRCDARKNIRVLNG